MINICKFNIHSAAPSHRSFNQIVCLLHFSIQMNRCVVLVAFSLFQHTQIRIGLFVDHQLNCNLKTSQTSNAKTIDQSTKKPKTRIYREMDRFEQCIHFDCSTISAMVLLLEPIVWSSKFLYFSLVAKWCLFCFSLLSSVFKTSTATFEL